MGHIKLIRPRTYRIWYDQIPGEGRSRQQKSEVLHDVSKAEASSMLREREAEVGRRRKAIARGDGQIDEITISELFDKFIEAKRGKRESNTTKRYESLIRVYIKPAFGHLAGKDLRARELMEMYAEWERLGRDGRRISARTINHVHELIRNGLGWGVRAELLSRNVATILTKDDLPKVIKQKPIGLSEAELNTVLDAARNPTTTAKRRGTLSAQSWFYPAVLLCAHTGARRGECVGMRWSRVDLEGKKITIDLELTESMERKLPKDDEARTICIGDDLCEVLREHRLAQEREKELARSSYVDEDFVFAQWDGSPIPPWNFGRAVRDLIRRAGVTPITLHGLRDTHASLLGLAGIAIEVTSHRLGHSNLQITKDRYTFIYEERDAKAAAAFEGQLRR